MKIVLASHNEGKIKEFNDIFKPFEIEVIPQSEFGIGEIEETGTTFVENAILKARHAAKISQLPALADDSGLVIKALKGAPGVYSARYAGPDANFKANISKVLQEMEKVSVNERYAYFYCVLAFMPYADDPAPIVCEGKWEGSITLQPKGDKGFGYDPIFYVPGAHQTAAELDPNEKNQLSHRAAAVQKLFKHFADIL